MSLSKPQLKASSKKILFGLVSSISKILSKFNININLFTNMLLIETVNNSYRINKRIYKTSLLTGVDHRTVSKIIQNNYDSKIHKGAIVEMIVLQELNNSSKYYKNAMVPKKGDLNSLNSILKRRGYAYIRSKTIIEVLVARGVIKEFENHVQYLGNNYCNQQSDVEYFSVLSRTFQRYSNTFLFNHANPSKQRTKYDLGIFSSQIHPSKFKDIEKETYLMCREFHDKVNSLLASYETHPPGTFNEIGVYVFQYNLNNRGEPYE